MISQLIVIVLSVESLCAFTVPYQESSPKPKINCQTDVIQKLWEHPSKPIELLQKPLRGNNNEPPKYGVIMHKFIPPFSAKQFFPYGIPADFSLEFTFLSGFPPQRKHVFSKWSRYFKILIFQVKTEQRQLEIYADGDILRVTVAENGSLISQGHFRIGSNYKVIDGRKHTIGISVQNTTVRMWKDCLPVQSYNPKGFVFVYYNSENPITGNDFFEIKFDDVNLISMKFYCDPSIAETLQCEKLTNDRTLAKNYTVELIPALTGRLPNTPINDLPFYRFPKPVNISISPIDIFHPEFMMDFAVELVFRVNNNTVGKDDGWPIFHVESQNTVGNGDTLMSVKLWSQHRAITFVLSQQLQTQSCIEIIIPNVQVFDGFWHRVVMSYTQQTVQFWVDCASKKNSDDLHLAEYLPFIRELKGKMRLQMTNAVDVNKYTIYRNPSPRILCDDLTIKTTHSDAPKHYNHFEPTVVDKSMIFPHCEYKTKQFWTDIVVDNTSSTAALISNDSVTEPSRFTVASVTEKKRFEPTDDNHNHHPSDAEPETPMKFEIFIAITSISTIVLTCLLVIYRRQILLFGRNSAIVFRRQYGTMRSNSVRETHRVHLNNFSN